MPITDNIKQAIRELAQCRPLEEQTVLVREVFDKLLAKKLVRVLSYRGSLFLTRKAGRYQPPVYVRKPTGRMLPCPGEAHDPRVAGHIDQCGICMPRWGEVEEKMPVDIAEARAGGFDVPLASLTDEQRAALKAEGVPMRERTDFHRGGGESSYNVFRFALTGPACGHSVCSQNYIDTAERACVEGGA